MIDVVFKAIAFAMALFVDSNIKASIKLTWYKKTI